MTAPLLVTWDIDGTLLHARGASGNMAHKRAIEDAVKTVYGVQTRVNDVPHAGATDRAIIRDMCLVHGIEREKIEGGMAAAIAEADRLIGEYVEGDMSALVLPGVRELLEGLRKQGVKMALATGNLESCAWAKVRAAGLGEFFGTGGFGSDCLERSEIVKVAIERAGGGARVFHVGDAVADMSAARENGVGGIGVLTGSFGRDELEREGAVVVVDDLTDAKVLEVLGVAAE